MPLTMKEKDRTTFHLNGLIFVGTDIIGILVEIMLNTRPKDAS